MKVNIGVLEYRNGDTLMASDSNKFDRIRFRKRGAYIDIPKDEVMRHAKTVLNGDKAYLKLEGDNTLYLDEGQNFKTRTFSHFELRKENIHRYEVVKRRIKAKVEKHVLTFEFLYSEVLTLDLFAGKVSHFSSNNSTTENPFPEPTLVDDSLPYRYSVNRVYSKVIYKFFECDNVWGVLFHILDPLDAEMLYDIEKKCRGSRYYENHDSFEFLRFVRMMKGFDLSLLEKLYKIGCVKPYRFISCTSQTSEDYWELSQRRTLYHKDYDLKYNGNFDLAERKLHRIMRCPKYLLQYVLSNESLLAHHIESFKSLGVLISDNLLKEILEIVDSESNLFLFVQWIEVFCELVADYGYNGNPKKLALYLTRDVKLQQGITSFPKAVDLLCDYNRMAVAMGFERTKYPKSLKLNHDVLTMNFKIVLDKAKEDIFKTVASKNAYSGLKRVIKEEFYSVLIPESFDDLVNEGKILSHCVASYVEEIIKSKCKIVFLRETENINQPLLTIEIRGNTVRQIGGYVNRKPSKEELEFIQMWAKDNGLVLKTY